MKYTINEIKNSLERLSNRSELAEERIHKLENRFIEIIQSKGSEWKKKKNEQDLSTTWPISNHTNMPLMGAQERNRKTFKEIMVENFPILLKKHKCIHMRSLTNSKTKEIHVHKHHSKCSQNQRHEKIPDAAREKWLVTNKGAQQD